MKRVETYSAYMKSCLKIDQSGENREIIVGKSEVKITAPVGSAMILALQMGILSMWNVKSGKWNYCAVCGKRVNINRLSRHHKFHFSLYTFHI